MTDISFRPALAPFSLNTAVHRPGASGTSSSSDAGRRASAFLKTRSESVGFLTPKRVGNSSSSSPISKRESPLMQRRTRRIERKKSSWKNLVWGGAARVSSGADATEEVRRWRHTVPSGPSTPTTLASFRQRDCCWTCERERGRGVAVDVRACDHTHSSPLASRRIGVDGLRRAGQTSPGSSSHHSSSTPRPVWREGLEHSNDDDEPSSSSPLSSALSSLTEMGGSSPPTSLCNVVASFHTNQQPDEMKSKERGREQSTDGHILSSPLAYKRKEVDSPIEAPKSKRPRAESKSKSQHYSPGQLADVVEVSNDLPWVKMRDISSVDDMDAAQDEDCSDDEDDDVISLLRTAKSSTASLSSPPHSSDSVTPRIHSRSVASKMTVMMDAIFTAERNILSTDCSAALSRHAEAYFTLDDGEAVLQDEKVASLARLIETFPAFKVSTSSALQSDDEGPQHWSEMNSVELHRLVTIMQRGCERATRTDPFPRLSKEEKKASLHARKEGGGRASSSPSKRAKGGKKQSTRQQQVTIDEYAGGEDDYDGVHASMASTTERDLHTLTTRLGRIASGLSQAEVCLALLSKEGTSPQLLCEETLLPALMAIKSTMERVVIPLALACSPSSPLANPLLDQLVVGLGTHHQEDVSSKSDTPAKASSLRGTMGKCVHLLSNVIRSILTSLPRLEKVLKNTNVTVSTMMAYCMASAFLPVFSLLDSESDGRGEIKKAALTCIGVGSSPMKSFQLSAIHVLRLTYERNEEQRGYIISTIIEGMKSIHEAPLQSRRQFGLAKGRGYVSSATALLMQIIQASATSIESANKKLGLDLELSDGETESDDRKRAGSQDEDDAEDVYELEYMREGVLDSRQASDSIAQHLLEMVKSVSGFSKTGKCTGTSAASVTVLDTIVTDLLAMLLCPEWPGAVLLLSRLCTRFFACLSTDQCTYEMRGTVLEQLSKIARRWAESKRRHQASAVAQSIASIMTICNAREVSLAKALDAAYWTVIRSLQQGSGDDGSLQSAARYLQAQWGREMAALLHRSTDLLEMDLVKDGDAEEDARITVLVAETDSLITDRFLEMQRCKNSLHLAGEGNKQLFASYSIEEVFEGLVHSFHDVEQLDEVKQYLLSASSGPNAANRSKALHGLSELCEIDSDFLQNGPMEGAVRRCLFDESVHVRDTAVALLGRVVLSHPRHLSTLFPLLLQRATDKGLAVRKRTLRLLRDVYGASSEEAVKVDAACEIVRCVDDDEETLKDLAIKCVTEIWFDMSSLAKSPSKSKREVGRRASQENGSDAEEPGLPGEASVRLGIIVQVADRLRAKTSPILSVLREIVDRQGGEDLEKQMRTLVHLTVDKIVASHQSSQQDLPIAELVKQVDVVALFVQTSPTTLSISKAKALLPYLRSGSGEADARLLGLLLNIYSSCLPRMASTAFSFARQLQEKLTVLLSKPSYPLPLLEDLIRCFCTLVRHHTHDVSILSLLLQKGYAYINSDAAHSATQGEANRTAKIMMAFTALLVENADFDSIRRERPEVAHEIDATCNSSVSSATADLLCGLRSVAGLQAVALKALCFVCRGFPSLVLTDCGKEDIGALLEHTLEQGSEADKSIVLSLMADIMAQEAAKLVPVDTSTSTFNKKARPSRKVVDSVELEGKAEGQGNSVTSDVVARFGHFLDSLARQERLQMQVLDILEVIVRRSICHPLQHLGTIISLQTVTNSKLISKRAQSLHRLLLNKNKSTISCRHYEHARFAWLFQTQRHSEDVRGFTLEAVAVFETWYDTMREQKQLCHDYLKSLIKAFDIDTSSELCEREDVQFARFVADNLATLEYATKEEIVLVASRLHSILTSAGEQVLMAVQEELPVDGEAQEDEEDIHNAASEDAELQRTLVVGRMSSIMSIALRLRASLCEQFGLSEKHISQGMDKKDRKASNVAPVRKAPAIVSMLDDLPGITQRRENVRLAWREMSTFENLLNSEGLGSTAEEYDSDT